MRVLSSCCRLFVVCFTNDSAHQAGRRPPRWPLASPPPGTSSPAECSGMNVGHARPPPPGSGQRAAGKQIRRRPATGRGGEDDKVGQQKQGAAGLDADHDQQRIQREIHLREMRTQEQKERVSVHQHAEHAQWHDANQIVEEPGAPVRPGSDRKWRNDGIPSRPCIVVK